MYTEAYRRYQAAFVEFNGAVGQLAGKAVDMARFEAECMLEVERVSKALLKTPLAPSSSASPSSSAGPGQGPADTGLQQAALIATTLQATTTHDWLRKPLGHCDSTVGLLRQLQGQIVGLANGGELEAAVAGVADMYQAIADSMLVAPASALLSGDNTEAFRKLCDKKFKGLSPPMYTPTRYLIGSWKVRQVKTKKTGFLARFDDAADENTGTAADLHSKYRKAGAQCKLYIFNDSLLVSRKRAGARVCMHFASLHDVEVIQPDATLDVFGLNLVSHQSGDKQVCHVFKGGDATDNTTDFIAALQAEIAMDRGRRRSEVVLPRSQSWKK